MEALQKEQIELCPGDFVLPVSFLLSMSLLGLEFPFAYILVFIILYFSWTINKYDFLLQSTLLFGVYGFYDENLTFPFKLHDLLFIVYFAGFFIYWKNKNIRRLLIPVSIYILFLFFVAMLSDEFLMIQARRLRLYMHILYFLFPLLVFRKQEVIFQQIVYLRIDYQLFLYYRFVGSEQSYLSTTHNMGRFDLFNFGH